jgi:hypothetical protein
MVMIFLSGCATVGSLPQAGGIPIGNEYGPRNYINSRVYIHPYPRVFTSAKVVLKAWNFSIEKANMSDHVILASGQTQAFSSGAVLGLYFTELGPDKTLVETVEKRKLATQIAIKWHSSIVLDGIEKQLSLEDATRP